MASSTKYIRWFSDLGVSDVPLVGGKNASLGEMVRELATEGVRVPDGFAITADDRRLPGPLKHQAWVRRVLSPVHRRPVDATSMLSRCWHCSNSDPKDLDGNIGEISGLGRGT